MVSVIRRYFCSIFFIHFQPNFTSHSCHHYDFLVCFQNELNFFKNFSSGIDHNPHVSYVHMTYVYSFFYVSFLSWSYGQEKSLSYYDLFDFRVLFYGCIPPLIFLFLFHHPTPILTIQILIIQADLEKGMRRP